MSAQRSIKSSKKKGGDPVFRSVHGLEKWLTGPEGHITQNVMVPLSVWTQMHNHPRQRDTKSHARAKHFLEANQMVGAQKERFRTVKAAYFEGAFYKVDGHTRTYLWGEENPRIPLPSDGMVRIELYHVQTREELNGLYKMEDAASAAERHFQQYYGALREAGMELQSKRMKKGYISGAVALAIRGMPSSRQPRQMPLLDPYKAITVIGEELAMLDTLDMKPNLFHSGVLAAALLSVAKDPKVLEFWDNFNAGVVFRSADGTAWNEVGAYREYVTANRSQANSRDPQFQMGLLGMGLRATDHWLRGSAQGNTVWMKQKVRPMDHWPFIDALRIKKEYEWEEDNLFYPPDWQPEERPAPENAQSSVKTKKSGKVSSKKKGSKKKAATKHK